MVYYGSWGVIARHPCTLHCSSIWIRLFFYRTSLESSRRRKSAATDGIRLSQFFGWLMSAWSWRLRQPDPNTVSLRILILHSVSIGSEFFISGFQSEMRFNSEGILSPIWPRRSFGGRWGNPESKQKKKEYVCHRSEILTAHWIQSEIQYFFLMSDFHTENQY